MAAADRLQNYMDKLIDQLKTEHPSLKADLEYVFTEVANNDRRYLAVWGYVRFPRLGRGTMEASWPLSRSATLEPDVSKAIDKVIEKFVPPDATYTLDVADRGVRTLAMQVTLWNGNKTVGTLGQELNTALLTEIAKYPDIPAAEDLKKFRTYLAGFTFSNNRAPTNATPGLSMHGQGRAFDFVIKKGGKAVTDISTSKTSIAVWDGPDNWTGKLKDAVAAANKELAAGRFEGPLPTPYEPWHYNYMKN